MTIKVITLDNKFIVKLLPPRPKNANKGTFGSVLVMAGSQNLPGAAYLCCAACYRVGAGLVTLATEPKVKNIIARQLPELTYILPGDFENKQLKYNAFLLGPGLGQDDQKKEFIQNLLKTIKLPTVIDADGLNILSKLNNWWEKLHTDTILTPHPGEMSRLTGVSLENIQADRMGIAKYYSQKWNKIVVLKGANTVVVAPGGDTFLSPFANPVLATAGTGDILAGIIAGFLAQKLSPINATILGVYIHGLAAEQWSKEFGDRGLLASDLLKKIPKIFKELI